MKGLLAHQGSLAEARHLQPDLVNARDQHAQVVGDHLAKHFVEPDGVRWVVRAGPDTDGGFYTSISRIHGDATAESGMGGDKLPPGQLINVWIGQADGTPLFVMARAAPQVQRVTVVLASAARGDLALSPVIEDFGLRFAAGPLPDDDPPVRMEVAVEGGETQVGPLRWPPRRFRPPLRGT